MASSQIASSAFTWGTIAVLPFYTLMVVAPNADVTKRAVDSSAPYVALGILYAYYLEQPDKGLEQLQKALDNPNTPADLKKAVAEEVTKIKEHKNHTPQQAQ